MSLEQNPGLSPSARHKIVGQVNTKHLPQNHKFTAPPTPWGVNTAGFVRMWMIQKDYLLGTSTNSPPVLRDGLNLGLRSASHEEKEWSLQLHFIAGDGRPPAKWECDWMVVYYDDLNYPGNPLFVSYCNNCQWKFISIKHITPRKVPQLCLINIHSGNHATLPDWLTVMTPATIHPRYVILTHPPTSTDQTTQCK